MIVSFFCFVVAHNINVKRKNAKFIRFRIKCIFRMMKCIILGIIKVKLKKPQNYQRLFYSLKFHFFSYFTLSGLLTMGTFLTNPCFSLTISSSSNRRPSGKIKLAGIPDNLYSQLYNLLLTGCTIVL